MQDQRVRLFAAPGPQCPRDCGGNAAAHGSGRNHLHQHDHGKYQRHAGQRIGTETRDPPGFDQPVDACASMTRILGQARRSSVGTMAPRSIARVRESTSAVRGGAAPVSAMGAVLTALHRRGNHDSLRFLPRAGLDDGFAGDGLLLIDPCVAAASALAGGRAGDKRKVAFVDRSAASPIDQHGICRCLSFSLHEQYARALGSEVLVAPCEHARRCTGRKSRPLSVRIYS